MKQVGFLHRAALSATCAALSLAGGCKAHPSDAAPAASGSPVASASAAARPKGKPWFAGGFTGQYLAKLAHVELKTGAIREWGADDGKAASGPGTLTLTIDDDGLVGGSSEGALGPSLANGKVEDDTLRVLFVPRDPTGLRGVLVASREGDGFKGTMQASSTDSLEVRSAQVELKKQVN